jgi:hypothetical protein
VILDEEMAFGHNRCHSKLDYKAIDQNDVRHCANDRFEEVGELGWVASAAWNWSSLVEQAHRRQPKWACRLMLGG